MQKFVNANKELQCNAKISNNENVHISSLVFLSFSDVVTNANGI